MCQCMYTGWSCFRHWHWVAKSWSCLRRRQVCCVLYVAATSGYCIHLNPFLFPVFVLLAFLFEVNSGLANTHAFNGPLSGTTQVSRYQKGKTNLDFTEARDSEWQWHQLGYVQVCTLLQTDNHASTHHSVFLQVGGGCLSCHPTKSVKALKAPQVQPSAMENWVIKWIGIWVWDSSNECVLEMLPCTLLYRWFSAGADAESGWNQDDVWPVELRHQLTEIQCCLSERGCRFWYNQVSVDKIYWILLLGIIFYLLREQLVQKSTMILLSNCVILSSFCNQNRFSRTWWLCAAMI